MIKLSEEGRDRPKARPLVTNSQLVTAKERFLTPVNTQMIRKQHSFIADRETKF